MLKHAFVLMSLVGAVAACGEPTPSGADAASAGDATPVLPDAAPTADIVSDLTDPEWVALCEELFTPELTLATQAQDCADEDCELSDTAVEDCVAAVVPEPQNCTPPPVGNPIRECDATVEQLKNCFAAFIGQALPYGTATCANVDEIPPFMPPNSFDECGAIIDKCPDAFGVGG